MNPDLLSLLVCPQTRQPVAPAPAELVAALNRLIAEGTLRNEGGQLLQQPLESALLRQDGAVAYPVREGIPIMLVEEGIAVPERPGASP